MPIGRLCIVGLRSLQHKSQTEQKHNEAHMQRRPKVLGLALQVETICSCRQTMVWDVVVTDLITAYHRYDARWSIHIPHPEKQHSSTQSESSFPHRFS